MSERKSQAELLAQIDVESAGMLAEQSTDVLLRMIHCAKETLVGGAASMDMMVLVSLGSMAIARELLRRGVPEQATGREPANPQPTAPPHTFGAKDFLELAGESVVPVTIAGVAFVPAPPQHLGRTDCEVRVTFYEIPPPRSTRPRGGRADCRHPRLERDPRLDRSPGRHPRRRFGPGRRDTGGV